MNLNHAKFQKIQNNGQLPWLLENDPENPSIRYLTLRKLLHASENDEQVISARQAMMTSGPIPDILAAQVPQGYWVEPGTGYYPKYRGTVWQIIFLAQLGADGNDHHVRAGCEYVLEHSRCEYGGFSYNGHNSGLIHCLQGNLCASLIDLGWGSDERLINALDWLARSITGEGIASSGDKASSPRYYRSGNSGPDFACSANNHLACAWGAVKAMLALSNFDANERTPVINNAIERGVHFLLGSDPATAEYPTPSGEKPNRSWFKFGFPIFYITDVLQNLEVLTALGCADDSRIEPAINLLLSKQDHQGRWKMEYTYNGKTWVDIEAKGQPSKWVTLRALCVLTSINH